MRYKLIDYVSDWQDIVIAGTCELCFSTAEYDDGYLVLEDENSQLLQVNLLQLRLDDIYCDNLYDDYENIVITNIIDFSAWLSQQDLPVLTKETAFDEIFQQVELYKQKDVK